MAKYTPAWQRTVLTALNNTPQATDGASAWAALNPEEQQSIRAFIAERSQGDEEKSAMLLTKTLQQVKPRRALPLGAIILLCVLALLAAPLLCFAFGTKWLAPALVACIVWELCTAKATRMRRLWNERKPGGEGVEAALKSMYFIALRSPMVAVEKVKLAVMVIVLLLSAVLWALPEPAPSEAKLLAEKVGEVTGGKAVMADALALLADAENLEGIEIIQQAMKYTAHGSDEEFLLAALMLMHIETRPDLMLNDYATGSTGKPMYAALENTAPAQINNAEEIAALEVLLRYAGAHQGVALARFVQQKQLPEGLLAAFGAAMGEGCTTEEMLVRCDTIAAAGHDPLEFLRAGMGAVSLAEGEGLIAAAEEDAHRRWLIRSIAPSLTAPNEVLAFIRLAKSHGVAAAECYPDGALLDWDISHCDPYTSQPAENLGKRDTMLILRRTEKREPYTTFVVAEEEETGRSQALPDGLYADYDPDQAEGAGQYTIVLEAAALDRIPPEHIPETIEECDALIILDSWYICDGYVRFSRSIAEDGGWKHRQLDSPTFAMCQEVAVYNAQSGHWLFSYRDNAAYSPAMLQENLSGIDPLDWNPAEHYIADLDEVWMAEACADFLYALERRNWLLVP